MLLEKGHNAIFKTAMAYSNQIKPKAMGVLLFIVNCWVLLGGFFRVEMDGRMDGCRKIAICSVEVVSISKINGIFTQESKYQTFPHTENSTEIPGKPVKSCAHI